MVVSDSYLKLTLQSEFQIQQDDPSTCLCIIGIPRQSSIDWVDGVALNGNVQTCETFSPLRSDVIADSGDCLSRHLGLDEGLWTVQV